MTRCPLRAAAIVLAIASVAHAAPAVQWTIVRDDFTRVPAQIQSIDAAAVHAADGDVPLARVLRIERDAKADESAGAFVLVRRDGQRLVGAPGATRGDAIAWTTPALGAFTVPMTAIASIDAAAAPRATAASSPATQDEVRLTNGDALLGIVASATPDAVTVQTADGNQVPVDWKNVRRLRFAKVGDVAPTPAVGAYRVGLIDGSRVVAADFSVANDRATFALDGRKVEVPLASVARIENLAGNVRLLADVEPTSVVSEPYFPSLSGRASSETSDRGRAIVAKGDAASAIAAQPRSVMTWSLEGASASRFHARYLIPAGLPQADVTIRVRGDDRVLFERKNVRSGETAAPPIDVELGGAKTLALEVDYGERYDVQDEFYWLDAALVK